MTYKNSFELLSWIKEKKLFAKKSFSQNFLIDFEALEKIVEESQLTDEDLVLEIGPGLGVLTDKLIKSQAHVISVEKDQRFSKELSKHFYKYENLQIIENDILKVIDDIFIMHGSLKIVANIPYNITSAILTKLCEHSKHVKLAILLVQKEFGERIIAKTGKASGSISRFIQFYYDPDIVQIVPSKSFYPKPKVDSCILSLKPKTPLKINEKGFFNFVRSSFYNRRKKLISTLKKKYPTDKLKNVFNLMNLNENIRAEEISLNGFIELFKKLN